MARTGSSGWDHFGRPCGVPFKGKHGFPTVLKIKGLHVGRCATRCVNADQMGADGSVGGDGRVDTFGHQKMKRTRVDVTTDQLLQTEGRHSLAGEHDCEPVVRLNNGRGALIAVGQAAMASFGFRKFAVVQADYSELGRQWSAVLLIGLATQRHL